MSNGISRNWLKMSYISDHSNAKKLIHFLENFINLLDNEIEVKWMCGYKYN